MSCRPSPRAVPTRRRAALRGTVAVAVLACAASGWVPDAGASPAPARARAAAAAGPAAPVAPPLAPELDDVALSSKAYDVATEHAAAVERDLADATRTKVTAIASLVMLRSRDETLTAEIDDATARARLAGHRIEVLRGALRELAVANYITGNTTADGSLDRELNMDHHNELGKQQVMVTIVNTDKVHKLRLTRAALDKANSQLTVATAGRTAVRAKIATTEGLRDRATADIIRLGGELFVAVADVEKARHLSIVDALAFPLVVLDAYVKAADLMAKEDPGCGIQWWAMAGIGQTESNHGTEGGAEVRVDGSLTKPILGIALDGTNGTAVVGGPGGFDRAQGPMQFISSTWARWARDGNGDGTEDIQNFYDAAAGAAAYLCAGGAMRSDGDLQRGYFSYNQSAFYVAIVLGRAHAYEQALSLPAASAEPTPPR